jgi:sugar phosphate isomerase/epimerase
MKTCFSTLGCPEWSFTEILTFASDHKFDGVEIRGILGELFVPAIEEFSPQRIESVKQRLKSLSLEIPCLASSCNLNDEKAAEEARAYVDTAGTVGTPFLRLLGDKAPAPTEGVSFKVLKPNLLEIADYAKTKNVMPLIETNGFFAKTRMVAALLDDLGHDNIGVLWDTHHPFRFFGERPDYTLKTIGKYIKHVHIQDSVMNGRNIRYRMPGEGSAPVKETVKALEAFGYKGFYSFEWVKRWDPSLEEPGTAFAKYKEFMDNL